MKSKKIFSLVLIIMLVLVLALVACTPDQPIIKEPENNEKPPQNVERILSNIKTSFEKTNQALKKQEIYSVNALYDIDFAEFKYTLRLNANFNETIPAASTIYFKLFDDSFNYNRLMCYYDDGDLYLDFLGETAMFPNFGSSAMFDTFYNLAKTIDFAKMLFSDEMIGALEDISFLQALIHGDNILERKVGVDGTYAELWDINLDSVKSMPNQLIKDLFSPFGNKLDALTTPIIGLPFSRLARIQIGTWTVEKFSVAATSSVVTDLNFTFSGQLDSREDYSISAKVNIGKDERNINPETADNPLENPTLFPETEIGNYAFSGKLTIGGDSQLLTRTEYDINAFMKNDSNYNENNKWAILLKQVDSEKVKARAFYTNEVLYVDLGEIMAMLGNGFGLKEMNFPKAKSADINLSQGIAKLLNQLNQVIAGISGGSDMDDATKKVLLKKISSSADGYFNVSVDKELVTVMSGGEKNVVQYLASAMGLDEATVQRYFDSEVFDKVVLEVRFKVETRNLQFVLKSENKTVMTVSLYPEEFNEAKLDEAFGAHATDLATFLPFSQPDSLGLSVSGTVSTSAVESDFSKFFGAFIGDAFGQNTPIKLAAGEVLNFNVDALQAIDGSYQAHAKIIGKAGTYLELWAKEDNGVPMLYIDYVYLNFKFKIPAIEVKAALELALGENNLLLEGDLIKILSKLLAASSVSLRENDISFKIYPMDASNDVLATIFNIKGLSANFLAKVCYSFDPSVFVIQNPDSYVIPELGGNFSSEVRVKSLYDASWQEKIGVGRIGDTLIEMYVPYDPESIKIVNGTNVYFPRGKLFGQEISYTFIITDNDNGTKEVQRVKNGSWVIDPWAEKPFKDTLEVVYWDGGFGWQAFTVDGFFEGLITPQGLARRQYTVHFGIEGKTILHTKIQLEIEVETRTPDPVYQRENGYIVLGEIVVDPLSFRDNPTNILPKTIKMRFSDQRNSSATEGFSEQEFAIEWEYDYLKNIIVEGSEKLAYATALSVPGSSETYSLQNLAYRVIVKNKKYDYFKVVGEADNTYTVDVLKKDTYVIPFTSTQNKELRIYFKDGTYRTLGLSSLNFPYDKNRNGYLPLEIDWRYKVADNLSQHGATKPLGGGTASENSATLSLKAAFGEEYLPIGEYRIVIEVKEPASKLVAESSIRGVVSNSVGDSIERNYDSFEYHRVDLGMGFEDGKAGYFYFDPYQPKALPKTIRVAINATQSVGDDIIIVKEYPVTWQTNTNIVDANGLLRFPSANETNFRATGIIGDDEIRHEISVVVLNIESKFKSIRYFRDRLDGTSVEMDAKGIAISAYDPFLLPNRLILTLENGQERVINGVTWNWKSNNDPLKVWTEPQYTAYKNYLSDPLRYPEFRILDFYKNPTAVDGVGHRFDNVTASFEVIVSVAQTDGGIYENDIAYAINVTQTSNASIKSDLGKPFADGTGTEIDPYSMDSETLYKRLTADYKVMSTQFSGAGSVNFYPVEWNIEDLKSLLSKLETGANTTPITLKGKIFAGIAGLEQSISGVFSVTNRTIITNEDIQFEGLNGVTSDVLTYAIENNGDSKLLRIKLLKPYSLTANGTYASPYRYFSDALKTSMVIFSSGSGNYKTHIDFGEYGNEAAFNKMVLDFKGSGITTTISFDVYFSEIGSTKDHVTVLVETSEDIPTANNTVVTINRYQSDGSALYPYGYNLNANIAVQFSASGEILFPVSKWICKDTSSPLYNGGERIDRIPVEMFSGNLPKSFEITAELEFWSVINNNILDQSELTYEFNILSTHINETNYDAITDYTHNGQTYRLSVVNGLITFNTIFDFYGIVKTDGGKQVIDKAKLPNVIAPRRTPNYVQENTFNVNWTIDSILSGENFKNYFTEKGAQIAVATIGGYGTGAESKQTVKLFVRILEKAIVDVTQDGYVFTFDGQTLTLTLDPYREENGYSMWEQTLPDFVKVKMFKNGVYSEAVSSVKYAFRSGSGTVQKRMLFNFSTFENNAKDKSNLQLNMILENGEIIPLNVELLNKTVSSVKFQYRTGVLSGDIGHSDKVIYIDPYDSAFKGLPTKADVIFLANSELRTLNIELMAKGEQLNVTYNGGTFAYEFKLYGYRKSGNQYVRVETPQTVDINVVVIPRMLTEESKKRLQSPINFENGIRAMLSDITVGKTLSQSDFCNKAQPTDYPQDMYLQIPRLNRWYKEVGVLVTNQDIVPGADFHMFGNLSDSPSGERLEIAVSAYDLRFVDLLIRNDQGGYDTPEDISFNIFSAESIMHKYTLRFIATNIKAASGEQQIFDVYWNFTAVDALGAERRSMILWSEKVAQNITESASVVADFRYGNADKNYWKVGPELNYALSQVTGLTVDFGYNSVASPGTNRNTIFIVDPLNPKFPAVANVTGLVNGQRVDLGAQPVVWENIDTIYPKNHFGVFNAQVKIKIRPQNGAYFTEHYVELSNLDRSTFYFLLLNSTYGGDSFAGGMYNISTKATLDPTLVGIFDAKTGQYRLPSLMTLRFVAPEQMTDIQRLAWSLYGEEFALSDVSWWLGTNRLGAENKITLGGNEGSDAWPMVLTGAKATGQNGAFNIVGLPKVDNLGTNPFATRLTVINRAPTHTNITGDQINNIFTANQNFAVDPYNVLQSLPVRIEVQMGSVTQAEMIDNPKWSFEGKVPDGMINGTEDPSRSYINVNLQLYNENIVIKFPVKVRRLPNFGSTSQMINGGTFYAVVGSLESINSQLPKSLYFNFGNDSQLDYTSVPLEYSISHFIKPNEIQVGRTYRCLGKFGNSKTDNFEFNVKIVSPKLYAMTDIVEADGALEYWRTLDYYYDRIPIAVNANNQIIGLDATKNALPSYLWLADNMTPIKITQKLITTDEAVFKAQYSFATDETVHRSLAVNKDGSRDFELSYRLDVVKNVTPLVLEPPILDESGMGADGKYHFELGQDITSSSLPRAIYNGQMYHLYWDMSSINVNRAFDNYQITGYLIIDDQKVYNMVFTLAIDKTKISASDIVIPSDDLKFTYSGEQKNFNIQVPDVTGENGFPIRPKYTLSYSKDIENTTPVFVTQQYLDSGKYLVKVTIDDINAEGSVVYGFEISKMRISGLTWSETKSFVYEEGLPQAPTVVGLPQWVQRTWRFFRINSLGAYEALAGMPINAGRYEIRISIPEQDNCFSVGEALSPVIYEIKKKAPNYSVKTELTYNGAFRHAEIIGLPAVLDNNMSVSYVYEDKFGNVLGSGMIRNAGEYRVTVNIFGGDNYENGLNLFGEFTVKKAKLQVTVGNVQSYYLSKLLSFTGNVKYSSPVGSDTMQNFSSLVLSADVTERSAPGLYEFSKVAGSMTYRWNGIVYDNYEIIYIGLGEPEDSSPRAAYQIKVNEGVQMIANKTALEQAIATLKNGDSVSYYLEQGDYGDIVLGQNKISVKVSLVGCYLDNGVGDAQIGVTVNSITVLRGSLNLSIIQFSAKQSAVSVRIGYNAGDISITDSKFEGADAINLPINSSAIFAERGYRGTVNLNKVNISGYAVGVNIESGALTVYDISVMSCNYGIMVQNGKVEIARSRFHYNVQSAVVINGSGTVSVNGCEFLYNLAAIRYSRALAASELNELQGENIYASNRYNLIRS